MRSLSSSEKRDCRVDLAPLPLGRDAHQQLPQVGFRCEMVAAVAGHVLAAHDRIGLQLLERRRNIRTGEVQSLTNLLRIERPVLKDKGAREFARPTD